MNTLATTLDALSAVEHRVQTQTFQWLTTAPNPLHPGTGWDAGQRGWRTHAVKAADDTKFKDIKRQRALCGLLPAHGWGVDLFVEEKCSRCARIAQRLNNPTVGA